MGTITAEASPVLELVGSTLGTGGFNARATGASAASAYFNPALLPEADQGFSIGTFVLNDAISITLSARSSVNDVPESALNNFNDGDRAVGTFPAVPTQWLERGCQVGQGQCTTNLPARPRQAAGSSGEVRLYQAIGFVSHIVPSRLTLGIYALVPMKSLIAAHSFFPDEREQFFTNSLHPELYSDRLSALSLAFGTGLRVTDWLSLGVSATMNMSTTAAASGYIGDSSNLKDTLRQSTQLESAATFAPHFAAVAKPIERLSLSATLHTVQKAEIATTTTTFLPNGDYQTAPRSAVHNWLPVIAGLGASFELLRKDEHVLRVAATGTFQGWSQYVNRQGESPLRNYHWNDTLQGVIGVRYTYDEKLATFLDGSYRPTPVPYQSGRTNYVDNDVFGVGAGANYDIPIESWGVTLRVGLQGQVHVLRERSQTKIDPTSPNLAGNKYSQIVLDEWSDNAVDSRPQTIPAAQGLQTNNPGWPGFSSEGFLLGTGVSVAVMY
ncbi:MAG: hypothetical protein ABW133_05085 [Polyangiaceae bacterium]